MNDPRRGDSADAADRALDHPYEGDTFDADEGEPEVEAFAGDQDGSADTTPRRQPREHGYGYE